ncbi:MAG: ribosome biogenesis GTPase Der [Nitrospirae bacterium]|nr:ribosome biogenesis GTPase Der [Nitrospirota bacterium]
MTIPAVALVGRVNVGKSTLFNALLGRERAVVDPMPGVTRDALVEFLSIRNLRLTLVDTGGVGEAGSDSLIESVQDRTRHWIRAADLVVLVVDARTGLHPLDAEAARRVRRAGKPFILAINKVDPQGRGKRTAAGDGGPAVASDPAAEFSPLAAEDTLLVSAAHRAGVGALLNAIAARLRRIESPPEPEAKPSPCSTATHVAVVGRPNAGKSTLINSLSGEEKVLTDPRPGTTRDTIHVTLARGERTYELSDSAGIRRRARIEERLEEKSIGYALSALRSADIALLVMDVREPGTAQDARLAHAAVARGIGLALVLTQCDLVSPEVVERSAWALQARLRHLAFCPVLRVSGLTGEGVQRVLPLVDRMVEQLDRQVSPQEATVALRACTDAHPPPVANGRRIRFRAIRQLGCRPQRFLVSVVSAAAVPAPYQGYLMHQLRREFRLQDVPILLHFRPWMKLQRSVSRHPPRQARRRGRPGGRRTAAP